jgi:signal transduction histidine kinase
MEMQVYYRLSDDHWLDITPDSASHPNPNIVCCKRALPVGVRHIEGATISESGFIADPNRRYSTCVTDSFVAYQSEVGGILHRLSDGSSAIQYKALAICEAFRRRTKDDLLKGVFSQKAGLESSLEAFCRFTFFEQFSFWLYNAHTHYFTHVCSSFAQDTDYLHKDDPNSTLGEFLDQGVDFIARKVRHDSMNVTPLSSMAWVNRQKMSVVTLESGVELLGILSFYSSRENFNLKPQTREMISEVVKLELSKKFLAYEFQYHVLLSQLEQGYKPGELQIHLQKFIRDAVKTLGYEAGSIFFRNETNPRWLDLVALCEHNNTQLPTVPVSYDLNGPSLTASVVRDRMIKCSYAIDSDKQNTRVFNEKTEHDPRNWIGVPIEKTLGDVIGVLRVKNRCERDQVVHFTSVDIDILKNLARNVAALYRTEHAFVTEQREAVRRRREVEELTDFLRTFRHEINSPLSVVTLAPGSIRRLLQREAGFTEQTLPKKLREKLDDLQMIATRLTFVGNTLTFEPSELVRGIAQHNLYIDVIAPVLAFAIPYAENRKRLITVNKDSLLYGVECDPISTSIAFHVLIDNAIKYSDTGSEITVYGANSYDSISVFVESRSSIFRILANETETVFEKYRRGRIADDQKTEGTGIGLYLAREIMRYNSGSVKLLRLANPVRFELVFKPQKER